MHSLALPIQRNPLATREDLQAAVNQLCLPLLPYYSEGKARLRLGATASGCTGATAELEGFSRVLWGLAPLAAGGGNSELWETVREGVRNGTDPAHREYWGDAADYDQKLVEMAAIGLALALAPDHIWEPLQEPERQRLYQWLQQINHRKLHDCNWLLFQVVVNLGFRAVGLPYDQALMHRNLDRIDAFYLSDGWYSDGRDAHCDYYGPFAIHYCCLIYAVLMEKEDPERSALYKERAAGFAKDFIHWFAGDGSALPFGRSLAYRFTQAAFWSAMAYAGVEAFPMGVMKGIILRNLRWWFRQPIFQADGTLTIGYAYPNLIMAENYNAPGSPYWALKTFLPLALQADHPFWQAEEQPLPKLAESAVQAEPRQIVHRQDERNHVVAFNAGHKATNEHTHTSAKYEKFAYSNVFGFSVPRAEWGLAQGAFDSMLALSEEDNLFRVKRTAEEYSIQENVIYTKWKPWRDVEVRTWIVSGAPWHVRVHCIRSNRSLVAAEGGFALGIENRDVEAGDRWQAVPEESKLIASSYWGASGVIRLLGGGAVHLVHPNANTNLIHPRTVIPTVATTLVPGTTWLATGVYGQPGKEDLAQWSHPPFLEFAADELLVYFGNSTKVAARIETG
ncbi:DUF2264 domain-containing protein [Paenibacillus antri]|uniref:DUF2264 domain-containing protein n=1 Tax=Paenibacillus antri TaxID=2582848 RepID=A0A5R9GF49_9BACL|nr:DUF2264 domain-containing protein [Paenibacillus antri]TLS51854.1 DUF2264 domain-containing protein [Paenibacillus antri]